MSLAVVAAMLLPVAVAAQAVDGLAPLASRPLSWTIIAPAAVAVPAGVPVETSQRFLEGRFLIGFNTGRAATPDSDLGSQFKFSPFIRNTPHRTGWGPAFGLSWYTGDIRVPIDGQSTKIGEVKVRPVMAGVSYAIRRGRTMTSFSLVGGYAFNRARITSELPDGTTTTIRMNSAWVTRPNVGVTWALTRRLAVVGSVGYVYTRPTITVEVAQVGQPLRVESGRYRSDYVNMTVGAAFSIF
ncbi:MAG: hypothetical protein NTY02_17010 [Acidobacteria bacterium]|nr:hypothetical protein [Acidobacteriota bacterium]